MVNGSTPTWTPFTLECTLRSANKFLLELLKHLKNNHAFVVGASKLWRSLPEAIRIERFTFFYIIIVRMFYDFIREPTVER